MVNDPKKVPCTEDWQATRSSNTGDPLEAQQRAILNLPGLNEQKGRYFAKGNSLNFK